MPSYLEFEGKSIENVTEKASKKLKIPLEALKYDVISYGSSGIFGLVGTKKAKIRVAIHEKEPRTPAIKSDPSSAAEKLPSAAVQPANEMPDENIEEALNIGKNVLQRIIDEITTGGTISVEKNTDRILFNIQNENAAILIGKRGQTLEAIQYLVEKAVNRQNKTRLRVQVDIAGYLENRKNYLKQLAERMAQKARSTGKPTSVGQLNAHDRRIVHLLLKNDTRVRTQSIGDGFYRKLVIFPKKNSHKNKTP